MTHDYQPETRAADRPEPGGHDATTIHLAILEALRTGSIR